MTCLSICIVGIHQKSLFPLYMYQHVDNAKDVVSIVWMHTFFIQAYDYHDLIVNMNSQVKYNRSRSRLSIF